VQRIPIEKDAFHPVLSLAVLVLLCQLVYHQPKADTNDIVKYFRNLLAVSTSQSSSDHGRRANQRYELHPIPAAVQFYFHLFHNALTGYAEVLEKGSKTNQTLFRCLILCRIPDIILKSHLSNNIEAPNMEQPKYLDDVLVPSLEILSEFKPLLSKCTEKIPFIVEIVRSLVYFDLLSYSAATKLPFVFEFVSHMKDFASSNEETPDASLLKSLNDSPNPENIALLVSNITTTISSENIRYSEIFRHVIQKWCESEEYSFLSILSSNILKKMEALDILSLYQPLTPVAVSLEHVLNNWQTTATELELVKASYQQFGSIVTLFYAIANRYSTLEILKSSLSNKSSYIYRWILNVSSDDEKDEAEKSLEDKWTSILFGNDQSSLLELCKTTPPQSTFSIITTVFSQAIKALSNAITAHSPPCSACFGG